MAEVRVGAGVGFGAGAGAGDGAGVGALLVQPTISITAVTSSTNATNTSTVFFLSMGNLLSYLNTPNG